MPKVAVYDMTGAKTGEMELNDSVFGVEINEALVHQAVVMQMASQRQGTHATKTRAMVRGGGRKPWKQKGTGRARAGSIRSPLWVGGGVAFGPHPRSYKFSMPRKARRLAIKSALTAKVNDGGLMVVENISFAEPKTKDVVKLLGNFEAQAAKALIITVDNDENVEKSSRNIPGVKAIGTIGLNVIDLLHHDKVLVTKEAVAKIEEVLA
ncbi:50S ribosomal protein L4 [Sporomusa acidovorans]|uniref:Large ribosomal subunit protein uL4 n=1 Tax=Sporomusa acidovorans (strain ATCC 49682 / DSM 3132 / Mol) TaxID=1123286 RepID=A0ABZ3IX19_SPOA4|nr:50S ribosomal protein L4 [Sporomusa acidovorans]OZC13913.1 50S ribosomal protein L4 [Sporomusa acidovorans DSM 3132]SDF41302.1 large subunit ribosomal protein L4 [Sporomusa acidovorans]